MCEKNWETWRPQRNTNDSKSDVYPDLDLIYNDKCGFKETSYSFCCVKKRIRFQIWGSELSPKPSLPSAFVWLYTTEKDLKSKVCLWSIFWQVSPRLALIPIRGYYFLSSPKYVFYMSILPIWCPFCPVAHKALKASVSFALKMF